jgi:hypothetical protein
MVANGANGHGRPTEDSALARLVKAEARLDELLARRRDEAAAILTRAEQEAAALQIAANEATETARAELEASLAGDQVARLAEVRQVAEGRLARLAEIGEPEVARLATWVVEGVLAPERAAS